MSRPVALPSLAVALALLLSPLAGRAAEVVKALTLKAGEELTFPVAIADGKATPGEPRLTRLGAAKPATGEITVGLTPRDKDLYSQVQVVERTSEPVDFVATGHIGEIVIDEREICGRLETPFQQHIGGVSWTVVLHEFTVGKGDCPPAADTK
ncbi:MAG: hypothetical protein ACLPN5_03785 [Roseiarcus sp.]